MILDIDTRCVQKVSRLVQQAVKGADFDIPIAALQIPKDVESVTIPLNSSSYKWRLQSKDFIIYKDLENFWT